MFISESRPLFKSVLISVISLDGINQVLSDLIDWKIMLS